VIGDKGKKITKQTTKEPEAWGNLEGFEQVTKEKGKRWALI
jgi:hypothetical protein